MTEKRKKFYMHASLNTEERIRAARIYDELRSEKRIDIFIKALIEYENDKTKRNSKYDDERSWFSESF